MREKNPDQYDNIKAIIDRQKTLKDLHVRLNNDLRSKEGSLQSSRVELIEYEKRVDNNIMKLNNNIGMLKKELEKNEQEKNKKREEG